MNTRTQLLAEWLQANGNPYHETRFAGQPHECVAVSMQGLDSVRGSIFWLADYRATASVAGNFIELQRVSPDYANPESDGPDDSEVVSAAYETDDRDPMGLGGI